MPVVAHYLRIWDVSSSWRVDHFVTGSQHVAQRIKRYYDREAEVIHPPVDAERFKISEEDGDYYLIVSAFAPYKRIDLAIQAFNRLRLPLKIVGEGQDEKHLRAIAGPTVELLGWRSDDELIDLYTHCRVLIFPGEEDFGIVPLEAMASGRPVIAYGKGGVLETVIPINPRSSMLDLRSSISDPRSSNIEHRTSNIEHPTGVFFYEQTVEALIEAVRYFEENVHRFDQKALREHTLRFDRPIFKEKMRAFIAEKVEKKCNAETA